MLGAIALAITLLAPSALGAGGKPILVHYMPWFVTKPFSGKWGWHWTMNHFDPDTIDRAGKRQIATRYYPQIGPYDSADPVVLEYHCQLMKLAGIDGVIVDWYGKDNYLDYGVNDQRTFALLTQARRAGLSFSLCYEDATIKREIDGGYITASGAIAQAQATLRYAATNYFASANYLRLNDRPVLLNFGPQHFKASSQWVSIFSVLDARNQPAFFTEDHRLPIGQGAFNWPPMWLSQGPGSVLSNTALEDYLTSFQRGAASWPAFISSAFPRFDDIYQEAGLGAYGLLEDHDGATFRSTLSRALTNHSTMVQLVTWNDFGEGTVIEPTLEFGTRDLRTIQDLRRRHLDPAFPYQAGDLNLPFQLYRLRRQHATNNVVSAELDRVAATLAAGGLTTAKLRLAGVESQIPVLYDVTLTAESLRFNVGGYLSSGGGEIEFTSSLLQPDWTTAQIFAADTNSVSFSTLAPAPTRSVFFRVRLR